MKRCPKCGNSFPDEANFCPADAGRLEPMAAGGPGAEPAGLIGGRFTLGERLGGGRTGEVYKATDGQGGKPIAVKLVHAAVFPSPLLAQRTERELKQLEQLDSAHVAKVLAHGKRGPDLWIAVELLGGGSLERMLDAQGAQEAARAAEIALAIGRGLADAARSGVVHRDLAPKNVLIDGAEIKLINFGIPVPSGRDALGVPEYISPEQVEGKPVDQRSNIYSLGAIYYALLTGRPPFTGEVQAVHAQHLSATAPPPSSLIGVGADVDGVVMKALERQPARRFMTLRQFLEELEKLAAADSGGTQPMGRAHGVDAGGVGGKTKKKPMAQTMMGGFQALEPPPTGESTQKMGSGEPSPAATAVGVSPPPGPPAAIPQAPSGPHFSPAHVSTPMTSAPTQPVMAGPPAPSGPFMPAPSGPLMPGPSGPPLPTPGGPPVPLTATPPPPSVSHPDMRKSNGQPPAPSPAGGKGKKAPTGRKESSKGKFRETMWFKKGELDAAAASEAAKQKTETPAPDKADELPIEDRYSDDGSISTEDRGKFSLRTGHTSQMAAMRPDQIPRSSRGANVSEDELISEMKRPVWVWLLPALGLVIAALAAYFLIS